ncbi:apolipoprotein D-like [Anoplophora glabripennis]|uniref:apolipoprotein D-like n=1 Tax=Anoplophora glabripennis TaxID=217634 RepID=UPI000C78456E|nr:apolipoprotein D-like [Anoplophora glabripennis]
MIRVYIFLALAAVGKAQIPSLGFCPEYLPMADFDMEQFLGKWYEAERYFQFSEVAARCVVTDYARAVSGKIYVSNEVTNRLTGVKRIIGGHIDLAGKDGEGKLNVKYTTTPISTETTLTVLDTDYDSYAVIWSCSGFGPIHAQSVWVMTRDRIPPGPVLQTAYGVLDKFKISRTFFVKTDQEGCALAASDINAANGITSISTVAEATGYEQKSAEDADPQQVAEVILSNAEGQDATGTTPEGGTVPDEDLEKENSDQ